MKNKHIPFVILIFAITICLPLPLCLVSCSRSAKKGNGQKSGENTAVEKDLYSCSENGDLQGVKSFLTADNINEPGDTYPPLHLAAGGGHLNVIEYLISSGADINKIDSNLHWSPIHFAVNSGHANVVAFLIGQGAKIDIPDGRGNHPIHTAASMGHIDVIKVLLEAGAKPDQASGDPFEDRQRMMIASEVAGFSASDKYQPIHSAADGNQPEAVKYFISLGISPDVSDGNGKNVLHYATYKWGWRDSWATTIRLVDRDGEFEKAASNVISTEGYYITDEPTPKYIRFMPEKLESHSLQPFQRAVISFGPRGVTSPTEVSKWLSPYNEEAVKQGGYITGTYQMMKGYVKISTFDSTYQGGEIVLKHEGGQLRFSMKTMQAALFPNNEGYSDQGAACTFVSWK